MIIGHEIIMKELRTRIKEGSLAPVCLFVGVMGIGKFLSARTLAEEMTKSVMDRIIIDKEELKITDVRELQEKLVMAAVEEYRVVIVRNIENMRFEAQNAFLKTLEEPPERTYFFLTCDRPEAILETLRSRCASFGFASPTLTEIKKGLFELGYKGKEVEEVLELPIVMVPGEMIIMLESKELREEIKGFVKNYEQILNGMDLNEAFSLAEVLAKDDKMVMRFLYGLVSVARERALAGTSREAILVKCCTMLRRARDTNVNKRLLLEEGFMSMGANK